MDDGLLDCGHGSSTHGMVYGLMEWLWTYGMVYGLMEWLWTHGMYSWNHGTLTWIMDFFLGFWSVFLLTDKRRRIAVGVGAAAQSGQKSHDQLLCLAAKVFGWM